MKKIIDKIFIEFNSSGIQYVVLRNFESLPDKIIGGDIDLLVLNKDLAKLKTILLKHGFILMSGIYPHIFAFYYLDKLDILIKFDIISKLFFGNKLKLPYPQELERKIIYRRKKYGQKTFYIPSPEDELVSLLLHCISDKNSIKSEYGKRLAELTNTKLDALYLNYVFDQLIDSITGSDIVNLLIKCKYDELVSMRKKIRKLRISKMKWGSVIVTLKILSMRAKRKLIGRKGLRVALLGPDGSGKTTLANEIAKKKAFNSKYVYMGNNNHILPTRRVLKLIFGNRNSKNNKPKSGMRNSNQDATIPVKGKGREVIAVLRFVHDLIDYYLRYYIYNYLNSKKGWLVINDRYIYDMLLSRDIVYNLPIVKKIILRFYPAPDFAFILKAPAEIMLIRKGEHTINILNAMEEKYRTFSEYLQNCFYIPTNNSIDESVNQISLIIFEKYIRNSV